MSDCQEMIELWFSVQTNQQCVSYGVCNMSFVLYNVQVLSVEMVDGNGEGQVSSY
jgi:hypothetical protein